MKNKNVITPKFIIKRKGKFYGKALGENYNNLVIGDFDRNYFYTNKYG